MPDQRVMALYYRLETEDTLAFESPAAVHVQEEAFTIDLSDGQLVATMMRDCATEADARAVVEPFLRAWEISGALQFGRADFRFGFQKADIEKLPPGPGASVHLHGFLRMSVDSRRLHVRAIRRAYPHPPTRFALSPDVEVMWHRYNAYVDGREPLLSMAYFCLSYLEWLAGGRSATATRYHVETRVLSTLGALTATVGDARSARKFDRESENRPLTAEEQAWIEATVKALIRRVGEYSHEPASAPGRLAMSDLPPLP
jgi:hypothetical protein